MTTGHKLRIPDTIVSRIRAMHPQLKRKTRSALDEIMQNPFSGKQLKLELAGLRSYKVGRFRIVYRIDLDNTIELVAIGPRKTIYEQTYRLLSR